MGDRTVSPGWARVVRWLGGYVEAGPLLVAIHDRGVLVAWRQVVRWEWGR